MKPSTTGTPFAAGGIGELLREPGAVGAGGFSMKSGSPRAIAASPISWCSRGPDRDADARRCRSRASKARQSW